MHFNTLQLYGGMRKVLHLLTCPMDHIQVRSALAGVFKWLRRGTVAHPTASAAIAGVAILAIGATVLTEAHRAKRSHAYRSGVAVITGASSGIGAEVARLLATKGAHVVLLARSAGPLARLAAEIQAAGGHASWYAVDCSSTVAVETVAGQILAAHGTPSLLVNSAGSGQWKALWELSAEVVVHSLDAPLIAAALVTRAFLPAMISAADAPKCSGVVFVQSPARCARLVWDYSERWHAIMNL